MKCNMCDYWCYKCYKKCSHDLCVKIFWISNSEVEFLSSSDDITHTFSPEKHHRKKNHYFEEEGTFKFSIHTGLDLILKT